ncbi:hypothetical protein [Chryseobacterium sp. 52]|uniref:hypothetical protein n=1 Tax=Chryseobacterium sp. 52 TaxID=2035213 RepID=UPI000C17950A|nr:hypothetical protein [Chryseobacterium sp. 52]
MNSPRHKKIRIVFKDAVQHLRIVFGEDLKEKLPNFQVAIHHQEPEINIRKLMTDQEIITNRLFFVQCAKDYRRLGAQLVEKKRLKLNYLIQRQILRSVNPIFQNCYNSLNFNDLK